MLTELSIRDFAIIDQITITFKEGLTVLTGETGAGKSIIIDAVQLLTGGRGSVEFVRHGSDKAEIQGLFSIEDDQHAIYQKGKEFGVDIDEDGMIVLQRTITASGKSICRVNGKLVTLAILREFGKTLIDIHSQHETQSLMDPERHIELLDLYARNEINPVKNDYGELYSKWDNLVKRFKQWSQNEQEMAQRLDLLEFQLNELQDADLSPNEEELLMEEREKLNNFEKIYQGVSDAYNALYGEQRGLDWLSLASNGLENAAEHDEALQKVREDFSNHYFLIEELSYDLRNHLDNLEFNPDRLNEVESRLMEINRLKKKYGADLYEVLEYASRIEEEIDQIKNRDTHLQKMEKEIAELAEDLLLEARQLSDIRKSAGTTLKQAIHEELKDLYLEKAVFDIKLEKRKGSLSDPVLEGTPIKLLQNGYDVVRFLISTNPGEPLKELHKIASGGELSRIMLALKNIFSTHQGVTSVIFDEVDTGVSGRVAQSIAEKIYGISTGSQVLCISHLPQVASMADTHLLIEKEVENERTSTSIRELVTKESVEEISRMMSGAELTETTKDHARELIQLAEKYKSAL